MSGCSKPNNITQSGCSPLGHLLKEEKMKSKLKSALAIVLLGMSIVGQAQNVVLGSVSED